MFILSQIKHIHLQLYQNRGKATRHKHSYIAHTEVSVVGMFVFFVASGIYMKRMQPDAWWQITNDYLLL